MTTLTITDTGAQLKARRLPKWAPWAIGAAAIAVGLGGVTYAADGGPVIGAIVAALLYFIALVVISTAVEGARSAKNRAASALIGSAFVLALLPLLSVAATTISRGLTRLDGDFFYRSMNGITAFDAGGGAYHAILGTLEQVGIAVLITVPLGLSGAIYIVEYGRGRLAKWIQFFVDVMTGIPSIVAGLFVLSFWVMIISPLFNDGRPAYSGFAASLALSVLMLPTIVRSAEEMLRLVPNSLREGAYALGIPKWRAILKIVIPTALPGIVTGVMLAVARAAGETAPVMLVAGGAFAINGNPFSGQQTSLSLFIYDQAGTASQYAPARAWTAALTLVALVLLFTVVAKLIARRSKLTR
ncbi:phosphate transport system permease protein PstA [Actinorhabdospora filicis]|uniref:Phosphate transport system permease protein PstA n=1 Tax=Actinorhabdospora filicis TaxID=1785913 RepID=A0A9W6WCK1_9ACTN|nr:phosphate ABC transporter permease PstA [Actinorhabdospora filicis]GLZ81724.1 phosphate transport system permease protein PstA [Actinorhabdospora filicis]